MKRWLGVLLALAFVGLPVGTDISVAHAQNADAEANSVKVGSRYYRKKTVISFGNDTIQGDLTRPDGEYIEVRRQVKLGRLINLREHWKKRISQAVNDL